MMKCSEDEKWMGEALKEGRRGIGLTSPNPPVGAVIVKDGVELARGWHQKAGMAHAERDALGKLLAGEARGATIYVTLEPCSTVGTTGACACALVEAGVARVVYGIKDPNPDHVGGADEIFRKAGMEVSSGFCEEECRHLIRGFAMVQGEGRPWVIAKTAMSLDGRITRPPGEGQWLTGGEARGTVHELRGEVDAIITSGATVRADDPALTIRGVGRCEKKVQPWRVVVTRQGMGERERGGFQLFTDEHRERSVVLGGGSMYDILRTLCDQHGVAVVLLEAGGSLIGSFLEEGLIDEWVIYLAPMVTGGPSPAVGGEGIVRLDERVSLKDPTIQRVGGDLVTRGMVGRSGPKPLER